MKNKKAVVLLSGGLDSTTTLYFAKNKGYKCYCLIFDYGQRHRREIISAKKIAKITGSIYEIINISFPWKGSSILDEKIKIPSHHEINSVATSKNIIPSTYVPSRNTIFLSFALSYAEVINAETIFIGANCVDYSGYPDCRPQYFKAFNEIIKLGTKAGVEGRKIKIITPLIKKSKAEIIRLAKRLGVPFEFTWSCYRGEKRPCRVCDSCLFREKGFKEAGFQDPLLLL